LAAEIRISSKGVPIVERALVIDPISASARLLADILRTISLSQVSAAPTDRRGLAMAREMDPQIIFVELSAPGVDGLDFTRRLRRSEFSCRDAPVVMVTADATAAGIMAARDAGVHEFLRRPYNMGDLQKRIDAVALRKRDWVEAVAYVGPDRRRFNSADYSGPRKRGSDDATPELTRITQALKIVKSAIGAIESDPRQVFRALKAQADCLVAVAAGKAHFQPMAMAAQALQVYLADAAMTGRLSRDKVEQHGQALLESAPAEARPGDAPRKTDRAA
jgi:DNA-binding response OmpR family regulator